MQKYHFELILKVSLQLCLHFGRYNFWVRIRFERTVKFARPLAQSVLDNQSLLLVDTPLPPAGRSGQEEASPESVPPSDPGNNFFIYFVRI